MDENTKKYFRHSNVKGIGAIEIWILKNLWPFIKTYGTLRRYIFTSDFSRLSPREIDIVMRCPRPLEDKYSNTSPGGHRLLMKS